MSSPAAVSSFPYPGDDPATVRQAVADLRDGRRQLGALIDGLDGSLSSMVQSWQGTDAEAARVEVIALASAARLLADRVDDAIAAMDRHGDDLDRIRRSVDGLRGERIRTGTRSSWRAGKGSSRNRKSPPAPAGPP